MTFFSMAMRLALAGAVWGLVPRPCLADADFYGYEDNYAAPEPDMVPVTPDDKPGRTVDEMLGLEPERVVVKKTTRKQEEIANPQKSYGRSGRFGSKEKISLRKGLNIPDSGIVYSSQKRREADEVRSLAVEKQEKSEAQLEQEKNRLSQIISPKEEEVKMIDVVPLNPERYENEPERLLPMTGRYKEMLASQKQEAQQTAEPKEIVLPMTREEKKPERSVQSTQPETAAQTTPDAGTQTANSKPQAEKSRADVMTPMISQAAQQPALRQVAQQENGEEEIILLRPPVKQVRAQEAEREAEISVYDGFVLVPPRQNQEEVERIVLIPPASREAAPSVEVFLDE